MGLFQRVTSRHWLLLLASISSFFVFMTVVVALLPETSALTRVTSHFTLTYEMNVAVWWSALLFFLAALAALDQGARRKGELRAAWCIWAGLLALMSYDELGSLHERFGSGSWAAYLPLVVPGALLVGYALQVLYRHPPTRSTVWLLLAASVLLAISPLMEIVGDELILSPALQVARSAFEEASEIAAALLFLWSALRLRDKQPNSSSTESILITAGVVRWLPVLILVGVVAHVLGMLYAVSLPDNGRWGDPGVWYPAMALAALSMTTYRQARSAAAAKDRRFVGLAAGLLFSASVATPYLLSPRTSSWLPYAVYAGLLVAILALRSLSGSRVRSLDLVAAGLLVGLLLIGYVLGNSVLLKVDVGVFVTGLSALMLRTPRAEVVSAQNQPVTGSA